MGFVLLLIILFVVGELLLGTGGGLTLFMWIIGIVLGLGVIGGLFLLLQVGIIGIFDSLGKRKKGTQQPQKVQYRSFHGHTARAKRVLIVEQEAKLASIYAHRLAGLDCRVACAGDGESAMESVREETPDVLVTCISMPKKDGLQLIRHVREKGLTFPILVITNFDMEDFRKRAMELGATEYHVKAQTTIGKFRHIMEKYVPHVQETASTR